MRKIKTQKINILQLVSGLGIGGAEILVSLYIEALGGEKYNHYVYCFGNNGPVKEKLEGSGASVHIGRKRHSIRNPIKFLISIILLIKDILKFIKINHINIIQSHLQHANQLAIAVGKISGIPAFPTIHNTMEFIDRRNYYDPRVILIKFVNEVSFRIADRIITESNEIKEIVKKKFRVEEYKITVLKNGLIINENKCKNLYKKNNVFPPKCGLKILAVGRLTHQKAMEVLIKATYHLVENGMKDFIVIIVGEGEQRILLEKMIEELSIQKYIRLVGIRDDVKDLMKEADIFVLPSRYEGLSVAMIEAMSCGLPIIASDAPGINPYIINGVNGLLFPIEDHNELSKNIIELANNKQLRKKLSVEGKKYFNSEFDMLKNISSFEKLIEEHVSI